MASTQKAAPEVIGSKLDDVEFGQSAASEKTTLRPGHEEGPGHGGSSWGNHAEEVEEVLEARNGGITGEDRANFIRKVYGILAAQMTITFVVCAFAMLVPSVQALFIAMGQSTVATLLLFVPALCTLCALQAYKADHPLNYQLLFAFTLLMSLSIGGVCAQYQAAGIGYLILEAAAITAVVFVGLSGYALYSGKDFTWMGGMLTMGLLGLIMFGFLGAIFGFSGGSAFALFGVVLFSGYVLYDTSRIMTVYGPDDAVVAAVELYLDILNLFLYILELLSRMRSD